jgi:hypothetical protein
MTVLLAALVIGGLPVFAPQNSAGDEMSATAQTRRRTSRSRSYTTVVPADTTLRIRLNDELSSKDSRVGDRFTATALDPERYEGATVFGHVGSIKKSGRVTGRTSMVLAFDSIQLRGGRRGTMRAEVIQVYEEGSSKVDEEGTVESGSRGKQTAKRAGIGAAAGAVLGAIVGGGKGAAIGLVIGGAAGAGSIAIEGSKELELEEGTEMLIRVTRR